MMIRSLKSYKKVFLIQDKLIRDCTVVKLSQTLFGISVQQLFIIH